MRDVAEQREVITPSEWEQDAIDSMNQLLELQDIAARIEEDISHRSSNDHKVEDPSKITVLMARDALIRVDPDQSDTERQVF